MKRIISLNYCIFFFIACNSQVYITKSYQAMVGNRQFSYVGIGIGKDSIIAAQTAEQNANKALEMAKQNRDQRATLSDSTGSGVAAISEMTPANISDIYPLPQYYLDVLQFELSHSGNLTYSGPLIDYYHDDYDFIVQNNAKEGTIVKGTRRSPTASFICSFGYSGYIENYTNVNHFTPLNHSAKMDTMTTVYYVWKSQELNLKKKEYKAKCKTLYENIKQKISTELGTPLTTDQEFDNDRFQGMQCTWPGNNTKLEMSWIKKDKVYRVRYSSKIN
jgi:hypothetical protein